jgi:hypothetical protein
VLAEEAGVEPTGDAFAPPDGFEDRAGHRPRCSSTLNLKGFLDTCFAKTGKLG